MIIPYFFFVLSKAVMFFFCSVLYLSKMTISQIEFCNLLSCNEKHEVFVIIYHSKKKSSKV